MNATPSAAAPTREPAPARASGPVHEPGPTRGPACEPAAAREPRPVWESGPTRESAAAREPARARESELAREPGFAREPAPARASGPVHELGPAARQLGPAPLARRLATPLATLAGVAAAFAYVGTVDPNEPGHYPVCPLLRFTGIYCPGCGGLRSAHAFIHGDLTTALGANAVAVVGYGIFALVWVMWLIRAVQGVPLRITVRPGWWWTLGGVLLIFSVVRNLPFGSALAP